MIHLKCVQPVYFDVDDTLIMWQEVPANTPGALHIKCPSKKRKAWLKPHKRHVAQIKAHKLRGHTVIVWSAGGDTWARLAVESLGLTDFVDLILEKPRWYYDDKAANEFMGKRSFLEDTE